MPRPVNWRTIKPLITLLLAPAAKLMPLPVSALPPISTTGFKVQPGCVCASMTIGDDTLGSRLASVRLAAPPLKAFRLLRRPPFSASLPPVVVLPPAVLPLGIMKIRCSMPAVRPVCCSPSLASALALVMAWRRLPWPLSLAFTTVLKLKPKSTPLRAPLLVVTGATACAVPVKPALKT